MKGKRVELRVWVKNKELKVKSGAWGVKSPSGRENGGGKKKGSVTPWPWGKKG